MSIVPRVARTRTPCGIIIDRGENVSARVPVLSWNTPEFLLSGRSTTTAPPTASRLGGATPISHRIASVMALEDACGIKRDLPETAREYRDLCLVADTARHHATHALFSALPDIMASNEPPHKRGPLGLREKYKEVYLRMSRLLEISGTIGDTLSGGRHGYNIVPGGVARGVSADELSRLAELATEGLAISRFLVELYEKLYEVNTQLVTTVGATRHNHASIRAGEDFALTGSRVLITKHDGNILTEFEAHEFFLRTRLRMEPWSYARFSFHRESGWPEGAYRVGPLARINNTTRMGTRLADEALSRFRKAYGRPAHPPMLYNLARAIEILWCYETLEAAIGRDNKSVLESPERIDPGKPGEALGVGIVEAPQGILAHEYHTGRDGRIERARVLTPLEQNNHGINNSCTIAAQQYAEKDEKTILEAVEIVLRCYDP